MAFVKARADMVEPAALPPYGRAMAAPILSYEELGLIQGSGWLFQGLDIHVGERDRLALIGRNGAGKTTLLKLLAGQIDPDRGRRTIVPGTRVILLEQEPDLAGHETLRAYALSGADAPPAHAVEAIADQIGIDLDRPANTASGGERRRAAIARALAMEPDVLLLDEPTNHLDLGAIEWLEDWLKRFTGAFVVISHDRTFLTRLTRQTLWLDRGAIRRAEIGFGGFDAWTEKVYAEEERAADKLDAKLKLELHWLQRGVTARRKRNQGRLAKLGEMRAARREMLGPPGTAKLTIGTDDVRTRTVIDAAGVNKAYGDRRIIRDFTLRIQRGDRIGIVGANGAGKSTLLKAIFGLVHVRQGEITVNGESIVGLKADKLVRRGVGFVPQTNNVFPSLSIEENLQMGLYQKPKAYAERLEFVTSIFAELGKRLKQRAGSLSGGERQMVAMSRALMMDPSVLLLDEPSAGLSPVRQDDAFIRVSDINKAGVTTIMVEQNARRCLQICDRGYVLDQGRDAYEGTGRELLNDPKVIGLYLGTLGQDEDAA